MGIQRNSPQAVGIINSSGQPEIVLEIEGLTLSMTPPTREVVEAADEAGDDEAVDDDEDADR